MKAGGLISFWRVAAVLAAAVLITGCTTVDLAQRQAAEAGARAADEVRETAEWTLCHGISVGAWRRAYAADPVKADGWRRLCSQPERVPR